MRQACRESFDATSFSRHARRVSTASHQQPRRAPNTATRLVELGGVGAGDDLPAAFRLFSAGVNESTKGPTLFDAAAAESVLRAFAAGGVDLTIDLEHDSLSKEARAARSDAGDARGWFGLEVRDGELWAVNVTWTPDGERRLRERTQRYISPAFLRDDEGRVIEVINVALCSMPATLGAAPLVASRGIPANTETRSMNISPDQVRAAIEALKNEDGAAALALLEESLIGAAGGDDAAEEPSSDAEPAPDALADTPDEEPEDEMATKRELRALRARLDVLEGERAEAESAERRLLVGDLVRLGAETPATAWRGDPAQRAPVARLMGEPIAELRSRVATLRTARSAPVAPPAARAVTLTAAEEAQAAKLSPEARKRFVALRLARRAERD